MWIDIVILEHDSSQTHDYMFLHWTKIKSNMFLGWKHAYTYLWIGEYNKTSLNIFFNSYVLLRVGAYVLCFWWLANNIINPHSFPFCLLLGCGFWHLCILSWCKTWKDFWSMPKIWSIHGYFDDWSILF